MAHKLKIIQTSLNQEGLDLSEDRIITEFRSSYHTTFKHIIELEDLLNKVSDEFTSFEVQVEREEP